jgi:hypothetical protein
MRPERHARTGLFELRAGTEPAFCVIEDTASRAQMPVQVATAHAELAICVESVADLACAVSDRYGTNGPNRQVKASAVARGGHLTCEFRGGDGT